MCRKEIVESTQWEKFLTKQQIWLKKGFSHIDQGIDKAKAQSCSKWKMKKTTGVKKLSSNLFFLKSVLPCHGNPAETKQSCEQ